MSRYRIRGREWGPAELSGGPLDEILRGARRALPGLRVQRLTVTHPGDDDNVYVLSAASHEDGVRIDTGAHGRPPFTVKGTGRTVTDTPAEALAAACREFGVPAAPQSRPEVPPDHRLSVAAATMPGMSDSSRAIAEYWDAAAEAFDEEPDHGVREGAVRAAWVRRLRGWVPGSGCDVLDLGCGTGSLSLLLAADGHRVTGVDLAPRMVERAGAKSAAAGLPGRFLLGDAAAPPVGGERFDVLLSRHLVWTLPEPERALRTWVALLRPGGRLVLVEGRWREAGQDVAPYAAGAPPLPWAGGVGSEELASAVRPLVSEVRIEPLGGDADLWGGPVHDERYALIAYR